jgi:predicted ATPase
MLGLTGSHRTGKTTLAMRFAQKHDLLFVKTSTSEVFARIGKDPKVEYPIDERVAIQEVILMALEAQYAEANRLVKGGLFIADRTPIDLAAYMLADLRRSTLVESPALAQIVNGYVHRCLQASSRWFSMIALVQPGIALVEEPGKAPACPAFMEHMNVLQAGLLHDERLSCMRSTIPRLVTGIDQRVQHLELIYHAALEAAAEHRSMRIEVGVLPH